jgi:hypothetical protein
MAKRLPILKRRRLRKRYRVLMVIMTLENGTFANIVSLSGLTAVGTQNILDWAEAEGLVEHRRQPLVHYRLVNPGLLRSFIINDVRERKL